jgi:hypothetical protein
VTGVLDASVPIGGTERRGIGQVHAGLVGSS